MSITVSPSGTKRFFTTPNPFEKRFGYHRAVRKANLIFVSGTTALSPETGKVEHPKDAGVQARVAFQTGVEAIKALGGEGAGDVVRVRMFVGKAKDCGPVGEAFAHFFGAEASGEVAAAATMLIVGEGAFVNSDMAVEIELDAIISD